MNSEERLVADFRGTGLTIGPHPMTYHREEMNRIGVRCATELPHIPNGKRTRVAGCVIARQRPGTAHGFVFLSLEDETGIANAIVMPDLFEKNRLLLVSERFLLVEGILQHQDNVISVRGRGETADLLRALATMQDSIAQALAKIHALMEQQAANHAGELAQEHARLARQQVDRRAGRIDLRHRRAVRGVPQPGRAVA